MVCECHKNEAFKGCLNFSFFFACCYMHTSISSNREDIEIWVSYKVGIFCLFFNYIPMRQRITEYQFTLRKISHDMKCPEFVSRLHICRFYTWDLLSFEVPHRYILHSIGLVTEYTYIEIQKFFKNLHVTLGI